ncbi:MAG TPA: PDZ domain-containing protein, partial [Kofleriaceae bacterium]|nr:PDZ domain-containing protein [Kofleriaceae bacterium]
AHARRFALTEYAPALFAGNSLAPDALRAMSERVSALVGLDAATIRNLTDMMAVLGGAKPGQKVKISVLRDGKKLTLDGEYGAPRGR